MACRAFLYPNAGCHNSILFETQFHIAGETGANFRFWILDLRYSAYFLNG
jgi:hypothetical protein